MSAGYPNCDAEVCVFDVLVPFFGDKAGEVAMGATCFPFSCDVAAKQARQIVITAKARMIYGMSLEAAVAAAFADADAELEETMARLDTHDQPMRGE